MMDISSSNTVVMIISAAVNIVVFAVGYSLGSSGGTSAAAAATAAVLLDRLEKFVASSWWNLYVSVVSSYITIRLFNLFIDPLLEGMASKIIRHPSENKKGKTTITASLSRSNNSGNGDGGTGPQNNSKDVAGGGETETLIDADTETDQPINMTGNYKLVKNENFESFLATQGVPRIFLSLASKSRPIHRLKHNGNQVTIKIEGIVETIETYTIDGPPIETKIRGKPFDDRLTYLTLEDLGLVAPPPPTKKLSSEDGDDINGNDNKDDDEDEIGGEKGHISDTAGMEASGNELMGEEEDNRNGSVSVGVSDNTSGDGERLHKLHQKATRPFKKGGYLRGSRVFKKKKKKIQHSEDTDDDDDDEISYSIGAVDDRQKKRNSSNSTNTYNNVCGIVNTKRSVEDGYTLTVRRHLLEDKSTIRMTLHVVYNDKTKESVLATQIYERIVE